MRDENQDATSRSRVGLLTVKQNMPANSFPLWHLAVRCCKMRVCESFFYLHSLGHETRTSYFYTLTSLS